MKKRRLVLTALMIVSLLTLAMPSFASAGQEPVGERLTFWAPPGEFPAGTAFNIRHGWVQSSEDEAIGIFDFRLEVDGVPADGFRLFSAESGDPDTLTRLWVYNFPDGLAGTHTFTGRWYAPCRYAVDYLGYPGPCAAPNDKVESNSRTMVVIFVP